MLNPLRFPPRATTPQPTSNGAFDLQLIDYVIIVVYFVGVPLHGLWVSRGHENSEDYFLAGRSLPWYEDFRYQAVALIGIMVGMIVYFW